MKRIVIMALLGCAAAAAQAGLLSWADLPYPIGEETEYIIHWGPLRVGTTRVTTEWVEEDGQLLIAIRFRTRTNRIVEKIYPVDDWLESLVDPETFLPVRFTRQVSEGRYRAHEVTTFDHANRRARWESLTGKQVIDVEIQSDTRDIVSFMYALRAEPFRPKTNPHYRLMSDEKVYDLYLKIGEVENVKVHNYGVIPSVKIEPEVAFQGLFLRKGRVWFWISRDARQLTTRMIGKVPVASVSLLLAAVRGPGQDAWVQSDAPAVPDEVWDPDEVMTP